MTETGKKVGSPTLWERFSAWLGDSNEDDSMLDGMADEYKQYFVSRDPATGAIRTPAQRQQALERFVNLKLASKPVSPMHPPAPRSASAVSAPVSPNDAAPGALSAAAAAGAGAGSADEKGSSCAKRDAIQAPSGQTGLGGSASDKLEEATDKDDRIDEEIADDPDGPFVLGSWNTLASEYACGSRSA
jgi:hypothetical protein